MGIRPIEDNESIYQQKPIYLLSLIFSLYFFFCRALAALGFGRSLPLCAEKQSSLLYESEDIFVALLEKQSFIVTKVRRLSWCRVAILRGNTIGDSAGTKNKDIHMMSSEAKIGSRADPENIIAVTLDDLPKDDRRELE